MVAAIFRPVNLVPLDEESGCELYGADDAAARSDETNGTTKMNERREKNRKLFRLLSFHFLISEGGFILKKKLLL